MAWLQENGSTLLFALFFFAIVLRGPLMARFYGIGRLSVHDLSTRLGGANPPLLLDVRTPMEFNAGHIPQAQLVPLGELKKRLEHLKIQHPDREVAAVCRSGSRSLHATIVIKKAGFATVFNVTGGMIHWQGQGYPVIR